MTEENARERLDPDELRRMERLLKTPIDFDQLVAEGKLERISATKYKSLVPLADLPEYVQVQVVGMEGTPGKPGLVLQFRS